MITRIEASRYRCFKALSVDLGRYMVFAGPNGSGKSTLLDIPSLLGELIDERSISSCFLEARGDNPPRSQRLSELVFQEDGSTFSLVIECRIPEELALKVSSHNRHASSSSSSSTSSVDDEPDFTHLRYEIRFYITEQNELQVSGEYLFAFQEDGISRPEPGELMGDLQPRGTWYPILSRRPPEDAQFWPEGRSRSKAKTKEISPTQLALGLSPHDASDLELSQWLIGFLKEQTVCYRPDWRVLRQACPPGRKHTIQPDGRNAPWLALDLFKRDKERFNLWVEHVQTALPQVKSIEPKEREEDHHAYFRINYRGGYTVTTSGLSEGTLQILALTLLPYVEDYPSMLLVEEPEKGVHPRGIVPVMESLSSLYRAQTWITTQSPLVIATMELDKIICLRQDETGAATCCRGDQHPRMQDWKGGLDLGSLFAAGVLA